MVSSPNYDRLKALINSSVKPEGAEDTEEQTMSTDIRDSVDAVKALSDALIQDVSVGQSETKLGADQWMNSFSTDTSKRMDLIKVTKERHEKLRAEMARLYEDGGKISDQLVSEVDASEKRNSTVTLVTNPIQKVAVEVDVGLYLVQLAEQRNQKREDESKRILDGLNAAGQDHADKIHEPVKKPDPDPDPVPDPDPQPNPRQRKRPWPPTPDTGGGGTIPSVTGTDSGGHSWIRPTGDEPGSITHPISDPKDLPDIDLTKTLVNARMTPNGPVGGHMPADVLNIDDPAWRAVPPSSGGAARIVGGTLVAGSAAGAAGGFLGRGGGYGGIAGMTPGAALRPSAPAGGVLRSPSLSGGGAGVAGRGGAGIAGRGGLGAAGRGGVVGTGGQSGARSAGVAGRGGAGAVGRGGAAGRGGVSGALGREAGAGSARGGAGAAGRGGAGVAGRGGAGTAGRGGVSGVAGREAGAGSGRGGAAGRGGAGAGRAGAGRAGAVGRGGAGGRGVLGGGSSAGRGEKKKETQRRNYDVVRIDGIEEQSTGLVGGAAGSADQLKPLSRDSGEDW